MTEQIQKAFQEVESEIKQKELAEIKEMFRLVLERIEQKKKEKELIEDELRILKLDLEDLKTGNMDKIRDQQAKSESARAISFVGTNYNSVSVPIGWWNITTNYNSVSVPIGWWNITWKI